MRKEPFPLFWEYICFLLSFAVLAGGLLFLLNCLRGEEDAQAVSAVPKSGCVIVLDAGHGGEDGGASGKAKGKTISEKDLNLDIALRLRDILQMDGYRVVLTREEDILLYDRNTDYKGRKKALDLAARLTLTQKVENPVFISIHMNAFPEEKCSGLQVWYSANTAESKPIADSLQNAVQQLLQPENHRETKAADSGIYLLYNAVCPSVLVECGFLSNPAECERLADEKYRQELTFVLWQGLRTVLPQE